MFINNTIIARDAINYDDMELVEEDIQINPVSVFELSPALLLLPVISLLSNMFYLVWSSLYRPARSSLLTLLSLSDMSLVFSGLSLMLSFPHGAPLTMFPDKFYLAIIIHFSLCLFFPLLTLVGVVSYLVKEVFVTLRADNKNTALYVDIEKKEEQEPGIRNILLLMVPSCGVAFLLTCFFITKITSCLVKSDTLSSLSGNSILCTLSPFSTISSTTASQLLLNPLSFPLTVMTVMPVLISLAKTNTLFQDQSDHHHHGRKVGWIIFLSVYSLFICDLLIYSQTSTDISVHIQTTPDTGVHLQTSQDNGVHLYTQPLEWRKSVGSFARNTAIFLIHMLCF